MLYNVVNIYITNIFILHTKKSGRMEGSFLVVSAESSQEIETMILNDPYYKGKVWEKWEIFPADM